MLCPSSVKNSCAFYSVFSSCSLGCEVSGLKSEVPQLYEQPGSENGYGQLLFLPCCVGVERPRTARVHARSRR